MADDDEAVEERPTPPRRRQADEHEERPRRRPPEARRRDSDQNDEKEERPRRRPPEPRRGDSDQNEGRPRREEELSPVQLAQRAVGQLQQLTTRDIEAVVGMSRNDNGNLIVVLEVVESHHFPDTADVMSEYSVEVDPRGKLVGYSRGPRYQRGRPGEK